MIKFLVCFAYSGNTLLLWCVRAEAGDVSLGKIGVFRQFSLLDFALPVKGFRYVACVT